MGTSQCASAVELRLWIMQKNTEQRNARAQAAPGVSVPTSSMIFLLPLPAGLYCPACFCRSVLGQLLRDPRVGCGRADRIAQSACFRIAAGQATRILLGRPY
jgi:hypothetical protein